VNNRGVKPETLGDKFLGNVVTLTGLTVVHAMAVMHRRRKGSKSQYKLCRVWPFWVFIRSIFVVSSFVLDDQAKPLHPARVDCNEFTLSNRQKLQGTISGPSAGCGTLVASVALGSPRERFEL
jgi:hypothetical protein